jgi:hypothetical protein
VERRDGGSAHVATVGCASHNPHGNSSIPEETTTLSGCLTKRMRFGRISCRNKSTIEQVTMFSTFRTTAIGAAALRRALGDQGQRS